MRYTRCKFGCDRSVRKNTLLEEQSAFWSVSRLLLYEIPWIIILITFRACAINTVILVAIDQLGRTLYLEGEERFRQYLGFYYRKFPGFFYLLYFSCMRYKYSKFALDRSITKGTLLGQQCMFSSLSRLLPEEIPWIVILFTFRGFSIRFVSLVLIGQ